MRRLPSTVRVALLFGFGLLSSCTTEIVKRSAADPNAPPAGPVDPLDAAKEGEPVCNEAGFCWEFPYTPSSYAALHASSDDALWAVGTGGTIVRSRSRGAAWRAMESGTTADLTSVFAVDKHVAWAVGVEGTLVAFDGTSWKRVELSLPNVRLTSIWASSATDAYAVGTDDTVLEKESPTPEEVAYRGVVVHWDGHAWSRVDRRFPPLSFVHGRDKDEVWVAGGVSESPQLVRWNGGSWASVDVSSLAASRSIYGAATGLFVTGANDVLITIGGSNVSTIARYDGVAWTTELSELYGLQQVGAFGRGPGGAPWVLADPPLAKDDEGEWSPVSNDSFAGVKALWSFDDGARVVAGVDGLLDPAGFAGARPSYMIPTNLDAPWAVATNGIFRFENGRWEPSVLAETRGEGGDEEIIDAVQNGSTIVAVSTPPNTGTSNATFLYRTHTWDGSSWKQGTLPSMHGFSRSSLAMTKSGDVWLTQARLPDGNILHRTAAGDVPLTTCQGLSYGAPYAMKAFALGDEVLFMGSNSVLLVDAAGSCRYLDTSKIFVNGEAPEIARGTSLRDAWVVTRDNESVSRIYRFDGATFDQVVYKGAQAIANVRLLPTGEAWFLGGRSVLTSSGGALTDVALGIEDADGAFTNVWGTSVGEMRVVGTGGRILKRK